MIAKMKMGPKGQVVIPKHFRDDFGLKAGEEVVINYTGKEIVIKKTASNIAEIARSIAMSAKQRKVTPQMLRRMYEEEIEERYERVSRR